MIFVSIYSKSVLKLPEVVNYSSFERPETYTQGPGVLQLIPQNYLPKSLATYLKADYRIIRKKMIKCCYNFNDIIIDKNITVLCQNILKELNYCVNMFVFISEDR